MDTTRRDLRGAVLAVALALGPLTAPALSAGAETARVPAVLTTAKIHCDCGRIHLWAVPGAAGRSAARARRRAQQPAAPSSRSAHARTLHTYDAIVAAVLALRGHMLLIDRPGGGVHVR